MFLLFIVFAGFLAAVLAPLLYRICGERMAYLMAALPLGIAGEVGRRWAIGAIELPVAVHYQWVPSLDVSLSLSLDGLSLLFVLLIAGMGGLIAVYARGYMAGHRHFALFYSYLFAFMGSMLGLVLAENLLVLYVFWELTTVTSFLLIGFESEKESARRAALQSLVTTASGGLALLAGLVLLGIAGESFAIGDLMTRGEAVREHAYYPAILVLVLVGAFTKSAQFPFHYWLPNAMEAPTPVSAYLHSATMVKAGVYLLARFLPVLGETMEWQAAVTTIGAVTMLVGAYLALFQHQLKAILAYLTINVLGTLVMLIGIGTPLAVKAAMTYLFAHGLYKGALFMMAGTVSHETGTLDIRELGGLWRRMPATFSVAVLASLSMAGVIPLFGFIAKELYLEAVWEAPSLPIVLTASSVIASSLLVAGALVVVIKPFFGEAGSSARDVHETNWTLVAMPGLLAVAGLVVGLFSHRIASLIVEAAANASLAETHDVKLKLWHGVTVPFVLSLSALGVGTVVYLLRARLLRIAERIVWLGRFGPEAGYDAAMNGLSWLAKRQTKFLQNGHLRRYVMVMVLSTVALVVLSLPRIDVSQLWLPPVGLHFSDAVASLLVIAGASIVVTSSDRYRAVAGLGVVGLSMSWIYAMFGAPDLAMTQVVVEALSVLLFVLAFRGLPPLRNISSTGTRVRDGILASCAGISFALLVLFVTTLPIEATISEYYAETSYTQAHGRNVVNTILVDFRALDTLGEATVLSIAAMGVYSVLRLRLGKEAKS